MWLFTMAMSIRSENIIKWNLNLLLRFSWYAVVFWSITSTPPMLALCILISIFGHDIGVFLAEPSACLITFDVHPFLQYLLLMKGQVYCQTICSKWNFLRTENPHFLLPFSCYLNALANVFGSTSQFLFHKCSLQTVYLSIVGYWKSFQKPKRKMCLSVFQKAASPRSHLNLPKSFAFFLNINQVHTNNRLSSHI